MAAPKNGNAPKRRTTLPVGVLQAGVKRLANRLGQDDVEPDQTKKLDHKAITAMSNSLEKLCRILLINDRQGRPENDGKKSSKDDLFFNVRNTSV